MVQGLRVGDHIRGDHHHDGHGWSRSLAQAAAGGCASPGWPLTWKASCQGDLPEPQYQPVQLANPVCAVPLVVPAANRANQTS
eukprot:359526-Chlamydomonas_euryale.AAC.3